MSTLAKQESAELQHQPPMVDQTIIYAMQNGATPEMLRELYSLQREIRADQARAAYFEAMAALKSESITIIKNVTIKDGPLKGKRHADLFGVVNIVVPLMAKHGLSFAWKPTKDEPGWLEITCTITHRMGHSESISMGGTPDTGPGRNAIQARGSAKSYLERYTLMGALGLAATDEDDDGNGGMPLKEYISDVQMSAFKRELEASQSLNELRMAYDAAKGAIQKVNDARALTELMKAKDAVKARLSA